MIKDKEEEKKKHHPKVQNLGGLFFFLKMKIRYNFPKSQIWNVTSVVSS